jgi:hypothetical protein
LDQRDFLGSVPVLQFFFAGDCVVDVVELLDVDEARDVVAGGKSTWTQFAVLEDSSPEIIGYANVESPRLAGQNVNPELVIASHGGSIAERFSAGLANSRFLRFATE